MSDRAEAVTNGRNSRLTVIYWIVMSLAALVLYLRFDVRLSREDFESKRVWILEPVLARLLSTAVYASWMAFLVLAIASSRSNWLIRCVIAWLLVFAVPFVFFFHAIDSCGAWTIDDSIVVDQREYGFLISWCLQGRRMAIGQREPGPWFYRQYQLVGQSHGDDDVLWIGIVRPEATPKKNLYATESGLIVGILQDNKCYMAYDPRSGRFFDDPSEREKDVGKITELSPFVLIRDQKLLQADIDAVLKIAKDGDNVNNFAGTSSSKAVLRENLNHPNAQVRDVAQQLLSIIENRPEKGTPR